MLTRDRRERGAVTAAQDCMSNGMAERSDAGRATPAEFTRRVETVARYQAAMTRSLRATSAGWEILMRGDEAMRTSDRLRTEVRKQLDAARLVSERLATARAALREEVTRYVRALKQEGLPPERVLVAVKGVVLASDANGLPLRDLEQLAADASQWSIDAYYAAA